jgi:hypothetical protein
MSNAHSPLAAYGCLRVLAVLLPTGTISMAILYSKVCCLCTIRLDQCRMSRTTNTNSNLIGLLCSDLERLPNWNWMPWDLVEVKAVQYARDQQVEAVTSNDPSRTYSAT